MMDMNINFHEKLQIVGRNWGKKPKCFFYLKSGMKTTLRKLLKVF